jgi:hypothetical protein
MSRQSVPSQQPKHDDVSQTHAWLAQRCPGSQEPALPHLQIPCSHRSARDPHTPHEGPQLSTSADAAMAVHAPQVPASHNRWPRRQTSPTEDVQALFSPASQLRLESAGSRPASAGPLAKQSPSIQSAPGPHCESLRQTIPILTSQAAKAATIAAAAMIALGDGPGNGPAVSNLLLNSPDPLDPAESCTLALRDRPAQYGKALTPTGAD